MTKDAAIAPEVADVVVRAADAAIARPAVKVEEGVAETAVRDAKAGELDAVAAARAAARAAIVLTTNRARPRADVVRVPRVRPAAETKVIATAVPDVIVMPARRAESHVAKAAAHTLRGTLPAVTDIRAAVKVAKAVAHRPEKGAAKGGAGDAAARRPDNRNRNHGPRQGGHRPSASRAAAPPPGIGAKVTGFFKKLFGGE